MPDLSSFIQSTDFVLLMFVIASAITIYAVLNPTRIRPTDTPENFTNKAWRITPTTITFMLGMALGTSGLWTLVSHKDEIVAWFERQHETQEPARPVLASTESRNVPEVSPCENRPARKRIPLTADPKAEWPLTCLRPGESSGVIKKDKNYSFMIDVPKGSLRLSCRYPDRHVEWLMVPVSAPITECKSREIEDLWLTNTSNELRWFTYAFTPLPK